MNDSLRRALFAARMTEEDLATHLEVDPKTVRRWLAAASPTPATAKRWPTCSRSKSRSSGLPSMGLAISTPRS